LIRRGKRQRNKSRIFTVRAETSPRLIPRNRSSEESKKKTRQANRLAPLRQPVRRSGDRRTRFARQGLTESQRQAGFDRGLFVFVIR
jgi:hypothetical protein